MLKIIKRAEWEGKVRKSGSYNFIPIISIPKQIIEDFGIKIGDKIKIEIKEILKDKKKE